jgi:hypothetical protein
MNEDARKEEVGVRLRELSRELHRGFGAPGGRTNLSLKDRRP